MRTSSPNEMMNTKNIAGGDVPVNAGRHDLQQTRFFETSAILIDIYNFRMKFIYSIFP